ncbi:putative protein phosphatase 2C 38-like [Hibiscus syriacus]|uniref:Protamine P1 family protein n=1 Tax=Hibiscus syriacus TaxID=106335 RepID=A0A6A3AC44_HIBSY|nr:uncharacterized protein LOC120129807 [Hibiscus syriacus]KAE8702091.1 putative protein phosphatase 2C 38-like [Hibiscus syriacus]
MKVLSKPISSPGRAEKYPPPLMRFLRSNVGSKSRGKSRTSPMFVRKKNTAIETQEPSSPKVTCMGQVRVKRSKQTGAKPGGSTRRHSRGRRCKWFRNALFCRHLLGKVKVKLAFRCSWKKWGTFFQMGWCRNPRNTEDSSKFGIEDSIRQEEEEKNEDEKEAKIFVSSSCSSPPKNALILTRCRSAPYRSSSLACRFWGSPLANQHKNDEETEETKLENGGFEDEEEDNPSSKTESICRDSDPETRMDARTEENPDFLEGSGEKSTEKSEQNKEMKTGPVILTRCKSEPARTGERLNPEMSLWKKRNLDLT